MRGKDRNGGGESTPHDKAPLPRRPFPGPAEARSVLRISLSRGAYAELTAHAKESLDAEVCGVLVGEVCEDENGPFVEVRATIRGNAAREARAHVTFTHETWNQIHATLDGSYPQFQIVGWYHTHPGFGVEFSAMDRFIQQNFFSGKAQVAFLTDPIGGEVSICFNAATDIEYATKFWVDGREHPSKVPAALASSAADGGAELAGSPAVRRQIERLEGRIDQLIHAFDEQQRNFYRMLMVSVVLVCGVVLGFVGWQVWVGRAERYEPPKLQSYVPIPVKAGSETVMLGVGLVQWRVPQPADAYLDKLARAEAELRLEEKKRQEEQKNENQSPDQSPGENP